MKTALFDFHLPESLIAISPALKRDEARMLVVGSDNSPDKARKVTSEFADDIVASFPLYLRAEDIVVFNDSRVIPARLFGKRGAARVEILLHKEQQISSDQHIWSCFAKPAKRLKAGDDIIFAADFTARVISKEASGELLIELDPQIRQDKSSLLEKLYKYGKMPIPPYIEKKRKSSHINSAADNSKADSDISDYQTIYARNEGSVAAPTAGLHFTQEMLAAIEKSGAKKTFVTLHVGAGTFFPVKSENTQDHVMHSELAYISAESAAAINSARKKGGRVIAVGTTSLRVLESAAMENGEIMPYKNETAIFITPGYKFRVVDLLLTNFHLPRSTLFMLVCAFSGIEKMHNAYQHAITQNYRFYSYGDACLLKRCD